MDKRRKITLENCFIHSKKDFETIEISVGALNFLTFGGHSFGFLFIFLRI